MVSPNSFIDFLRCNSYLFSSFVVNGRTDKVHIKEQLELILDNKSRTEKIQNLAQKMRELTETEAKSSVGLKQNIEKIFQYSHKLEEKIQVLNFSGEKLKKISGYLKEGNLN